MSDSGRLMASSPLRRSSSATGAAVATPAASSASTTQSHQPSLAEAIGYQGYLQADPIVLPASSSSASVPIASTSTQSQQPQPPSTSVPPSPAINSSSPPTDALVPYSTSAPDGSSSVPPSRQIARTALKAVSEKAQSLAHSSKVVKFGVNTTAKVANAIIPQVAKQFTLNQWENYGDPLLSKIDQRLDEAMLVVENSRFGITSPLHAPSSVPTNQPQADSLSLDAQMPHPSSSTDLMRNSSDSVDMKQDDGSGSGSGGEGSGGEMVVHDESDQAMYAFYWQSLKGKFVQSKWYSKVDAILCENRVVVAFSNHMMRPAESFYNTVTEEFLTHATLDEFLTALKTRVGPAWDDRLTPLAKAFFSTAKAVSAVVGAGRFVGGALQLGRARVHNVIDQLIERWEQVLYTSDGYVDKWLPDAQQAAIMAGESETSDTALVPMEQSPDSQQQQQQQLRSPSSASTSTSQSSSRRVSLNPIAAAALAQSNTSTMSSPQPRNLKRNAAEIEDPTGSQSDEERNLRGELSLSNFSSRASSSNHLSALAAATDTNSNSASQTLQVPSPLPLSSSASNSSSGLANKVSKRLRQRIASLPFTPTALVVGWTDSVRQQLLHEKWFNHVDEVLMQNSFIQALAQIMQPAEHFYNTSLQLFQTRVLKKQQEDELKRLAEIGRPDQTDMDMDSADDDANSVDTHSSNGTAGSQSGMVLAAINPMSPASPSAVQPLPPADSPIVSDFVHSLQRALGASWDERLGEHARSFFFTAWSAVREGQTKNAS